MLFHFPIVQCCLVYLSSSLFHSFLFQFVCILTPFYLFYIRLYFSSRCHLSACSTLLDSPRSHFTHNTLRHICICRHVRSAMLVATRTKGDLDLRVVTARGQFRQKQALTWQRMKGEEKRAFVLASEHLTVTRIYVKLRNMKSNCVVSMKCLTLVLNFIYL
jgi:hypothetical protein